MNAVRILLPIALGVVAAILNFVVLRGSTAPLELTIVRSDVKADTELTEDMMDRLAVRADKEVFKSAVPYSERGLLLGRRVTRSLAAGEALLYADVQELDEENVRLYLQPGETTLIIPIKSSRVAPGLRRGDMVSVIVAMRSAVESAKSTPRSSALTTRAFAPFRLVSLGTSIGPYRGTSMDESRLLQVAIKPGPNGQFDREVATLQEAIVSSRSGSSGNESEVLSVGPYKSNK